MYIYVHIHINIYIHISTLYKYTEIITYSARNSKDTLHPKQWYAKRGNKPANRIKGPFQKKKIYIYGTM